MTNINALESLLQKIQFFSGNVKKKLTHHLIYLMQEHTDRIKHFQLTFVQETFQNSS